MAAVVTELGTAASFFQATCAFNCPDGVSRSRHIVVIAWSDGTDATGAWTAVTLADDRGNTWHGLGQASNTFDSVQIKAWVAQIDTALLPGENITFSGAGGVRLNALVYEVAGLKQGVTTGTPNALDQHDVRFDAGNTTTPSVATPGNTTQAAELALAAFAYLAVDPDMVSPGTNWTTLNDIASPSDVLAIAVGSGASQRNAAVIKRDLAATGTYTAQPTFSISNQPAKVIVTLKEASATDVPVNTVLPLLSGTPVQGQVVAVGNGTWTGSPTSYSYQWQRDGLGDATFANISSATSSSYTLTSSDVDCNVRCIVTATNGTGADTANTSWIQPGALRTASPSGACELCSNVTISLSDLRFVLLNPLVVGTFPFSALSPGTKTATPMAPGSISLTANSSGSLTLTPLPPGSLSFGG